MGIIRNVITMSESGRLNRCLKQNGTCRGKKVNGLHKLATDRGMLFRFLQGRFVNKNCQHGVTGPIHEYSLGLCGIIKFSWPVTA